MIEVLFATTNPAKIQKYKDRLESKNNNIKVLTLKDLSRTIDVDENGKDCMENAYIKAKAYNDFTGYITIGMDNSLFIEELPDEKQPGTHVRRVGGKTLTDDEMIEYYSNLAKEYGGQLTAKWVYGMVVIKGNEKEEYTWTKDHFYFVDKVNDIRNPGYPLDSMSIMPSVNKYFVELTKEEKDSLNRNNNEEDVIEFLEKSILKLTK